MIKFGSKYPSVYGWKFVYLTNFRVILGCTCSYNFHSIIILYQHHWLKFSTFIFRILSRITYIRIIWPDLVLISWHVSNYHIYMLPMHQGSILLWFSTQHYYRLLHSGTFNYIPMRYSYLQIRLRKIDKSGLHLGHL